MGTAPRACLRVLAALLLTAALTGEAAAANYSDYAHAQAENNLVQSRITQDLYRFLLNPATARDNARSFAFLHLNGTATQNYSLLLYNEIVYRMTEQGELNAAPQSNIAAAFSYVGGNASNLTCGNATAGNCKTLAGLQGRSRVQAETLAYYRANGEEKALEAARNQTALWSLQFQWWVKSQEGVVTALESAGEVVT